jgi:hypothetical protein
MTTAKTIYIWARHEDEAWDRFLDRELEAIGGAELEPIPAVDGLLPFRFTVA